jgi:predicted amidophosphoribosyltransferase
MVGLPSRLVALVAPCAVCGQPIGGGCCRNPWCARADRAVGWVYAVGSYEGELRRRIMAFKYGGERHLAGPLAGLLVDALRRDRSWFEELQVICPVPSYLGPGSRRTWSPVAALACELSSRTGPSWPVEALVVKTAETAPLSGRDPFARRLAGQGALRRCLHVPDSSAVAGARVLLLDDVCTAGTTLQEVGRALRRAGAAEVQALVLARTPWRTGRSGAR